MTAVYVQCGLHIRSGIPLGLPQVTPEHWDTTAVWGDDIADTTSAPPGEVVAQFAPHRDSWYTATSTDSGYVVRFRECGQFEISSDLRQVVVRRDRSGNHGLLPVLLAGTVAAFLLSLGGKTVLHASAVTVGSRAIAFAGFSGGGKTTVAALLCSDGAALLTDDVLTVSSGRPPTCQGGANELRLRPSAAPLFDGKEVVSRRTTHDGRIAIALSKPILTSRPLAAVVFPLPSRDVDRPTVEQLSPASRLVALLTFPRVVGLTRQDITERDFDVLGQLVDAIPIFGLKIPWGPPFEPSLPADLIKICLPDS